MMSFTAYVIIAAYAIIAVIFFIGSAWVDAKKDVHGYSNLGDAWVCLLMAIFWPLTTGGIILYGTMSGWLWLQRWFNRTRSE